MNKETFLSYILFKNEKGLLAKVATTLSNNNVNIEALNISQLSEDGEIQKVTILTSGIKSIDVLNNIIKTINGVYEVKTFQDYSNLDNIEFLLIKIPNINTNILKISKIVENSNGKSIFMNSLITIYEIIADKDKINILKETISEIDNTIELLKSPIVTRII